MKGKHHSEETLKKMRDGKLGDKNPRWVGDSIQYKGLHQWVRDNYPPPKACESCGKETKLDAANRSGKYLRDRSDWDYLCRKCHMKRDGRIEKLVSNPDKFKWGYGNIPWNKGKSGQLKHTEESKRKMSEKLKASWVERKNKKSSGSYE